MKTLTENNFLLYAAANYTNLQCYDVEEFNDDLQRFKYLKRLFSRYHDKKDLKERLILNHLITLYNVFEHKANTRMLFYKIEKKHWYILKTFLSYLQYVPEVLYDIGEEGNTIVTSAIPVDFVIVKTLREL